MLKEMWKYSKFMTCYFVVCIAMAFVCLIAKNYVLSGGFLIWASLSIHLIEIDKLKLRCRQLEEENLVMMENYHLLTGKVLEQTEEILERVSRLKGDK